MRAAWLLIIGASLAAQDLTESWKFAVSGDSRNCGDIVMPAIASGVQHDNARFYWHLGDFRAMYTFDEDIVPPLKLGLNVKPMNIATYLSTAWPDFIQHQLAPFGSLPVYLSPGNHEMIWPATREAYVIQFADWLENPAIVSQRLKDDPVDHKLRTYYHWMDHNVDFIALDNATNDQFDAAQMTWLRALIARDEASAEVKSIVVGMHEALPGSVGRIHSMSDWPQSDKSGRDAYAALWHAYTVAKKHVYVLASHSHFYMEDVYNTPDWKDHVLPGWIVGTAGAVRYRLPPGTGKERKAMTDVYGYMIGTVDGDGAITFDFHQLSIQDLLTASPDRPAALAQWCVNENKQ